MTSSKPRLPTRAKPLIQPCVVRSKLPAYAELDAALSVVAEGYAFFTYWRTRIDVLVLDSVIEAGVVLAGGQSGHPS
jgi:hypothetical protein